MRRSGGRSRARIAIIGMTMVLAAALAPLPGAGPAGAVTWCNSSGLAVHKESSIFGANLYWWSHGLTMCSDQNASYWTITQVQNDWDNHWDVDSTWSYQGLSHDNRYHTMYLGLWIAYTTQREGHFEQCFFFYCNNLYPRVDLHGENSGYIYLDYSRNG